jgi:hypothetical protein
MDRYAKIARMKDLLARLDFCQAQWQTAEGASEQFLAQSIKRELSEFRRLCEALRRETLAGLPHGRHAAA